MSLAVYEHHTEIAMLLVHRGAEVNIVEEVNNATTNIWSVTATYFSYRTETVH